MVGVPGRSKGCLPCRKRKIGCGLQRPACTQCIRANRECTGYPDKNIFVFFTPRSNNQRRDPKDCEPREEKTSPASINRRGQLTNTKHNLEITPHGRQPFYPFTETGNAHRMIIRSSDCLNLVNTFISNCFPVDKHFAYTSDRKPWIYFLPQIPMKSQVLESASVALTTASLGRVYGIPQLSIEGLKFYIRALHQLRAALRDKSIMLENETLVSCMALSMYEIVESPSNGRSALESHCKGMMELVKARGVAAHTSGPGYALFLAMRRAGIMQAIRDQTPNFLSEPEWMEGPWTITPKSLMDRVHDCLARSPAVLQKSSYFKLLTPDKKVVLARQLVHECWETERMLDDIYSKIQSTGPNPPYWPVLSRLSVPTDNDGILFPKAYWFTDLMSAWMMMTFWAARLMLWARLCDLYDLIEEIQPDLVHGSPSSEQPSATNTSTFLPRLGHRRDYLSMVHNVCQSVEYCLQESMKMAGTVIISIPLGILIGNLAHRPEYAREIAWIRAVIAIVRGRGHRFIILTSPDLHERSS